MKTMMRRIERIEHMDCGRCGCSWTAVMESAFTERLECPGCGYMVQTPPRRENA